MTRREMATQATLVLSLVCGIIGGNFVLHRWVIGDATSREAGAGTTGTGAPLEDLDEFAPRRREAIGSSVPDKPKAHREQLRQLIATKLPTATEDLREAWLDELSDLSLNTAEGILDLKRQVGAFPEIDESAQPRSAPAQSPEIDFPIGVSR